ncbi:hypothetical protein MKQ68_20555 [Chitinophaga horti]|uniref:Uncharacterized protein n=1 Tax=Chitinophaga horti TaxID=2920382 RepID=A0ABY6IYK1_9BACT|nr:hypothetical protein [Chitinophaga horti]UYQ92478.1 hypothetical protein MKQ68_20555 [Chitinophaga horti]
MRLQPYLIAALCVFTLAFTACKKSSKGGGGGEPQPNEEDLKVELVNVVLPPTTNPAQAATFPFQVKVTSKMPAKGVRIGMQATVKFSNTPLTQNDAIVSSAATTETSVINLPSKNEVTVKVIITSESKPSNKKEIEFVVFNKS